MFCVLKISHLSWLLALITIILIIIKLYSSKWVKWSKQWIDCSGPLPEDWTKWDFPAPILLDKSCVSECPVEYYTYDYSDYTWRKSDFLQHSDNKLQPCLQIRLSILKRKSLYRNYCKRDSKRDFRYLWKLLRNGCEELARQHHLF